MAVATREVTALRVVSHREEVDALCGGAATLSREGNRIAALALLWAAVATEPTDFLAHRRLAAALTNAGDVDAAAKEYARFIEFVLKQDDVRRAAGELAYARAFLGDMPQLHSAAAYPVPLSKVARALDSLAPMQALRPVPIRDSAASWEPGPHANGAPRTAQPAAGETIRARTQARLRRYFWRESWASAVSVLGFLLVVVSLATAATVFVPFAIRGLR